MIIYPIQFSTYRPKDYSKVLGSRKKKKLRSCSSIASKKKKELKSSKPSRIRGGPYLIDPRRNINIALLPNYAVGKSYNGN